MLGGLFYIAGIVFNTFDRLSFFNAFWHLSNYASRKHLSLNEGNLPFQIKTRKRFHTSPCAAKLAAQSEA